MAGKESIVYFDEIGRETRLLRVLKEALISYENKMSLKEDFSDFELGAMWCEVADLGDIVKSLKTKIRQRQHELSVEAFTNGH